MKCKTKYLIRLLLSSNLNKHTICIGLSELQIVNINLYKMLLYKCLISGYTEYIEYLHTYQESNKGWEYSVLTH